MRAEKKVGLLVDPMVHHWADKKVELKVGAMAGYLVGLMVGPTVEQKVCHSVDY
jgi:hypothetical protein